MKIGQSRLDDIDKNSSAVTCLWSCQREALYLVFILFPAENSSFYFSLKMSSDESNCGAELYCSTVLIKEEVYLDDESTTSDLGEGKCLHQGITQGLPETHKNCQFM